MTGVADAPQAAPAEAEVKLSDFITDLDSSVDLLFDNDWYLGCNPGVAEAGVHPLGHYVSFGARELRSPSPLFDPRYYAYQKPEVVDQDLHPLEDYLRAGGFEGLDPNEFFDSRWYLAEYEDARASGLNPLLHYVKTGEAAGYRPSALFDPEAHKAEYPDVDWSRTSPLAHFLSIRGHVQGAPSASHFCSTAPLRRFLGNVRPELEAIPCTIEMTVQSVEAFVQASDGKADGDAIIARLDRSVETMGEVVGYPAAPIVAKLNDVIAIGGTRYLVTNRSTVMHDEEAYFADQKGTDIKWPFARRLPRRRVVLTVKARQGASVESGIHLMLESANNYFHFIVEVLPRMLLAESANIPATVPFLMQDGLHPNLRKLVELVNKSRRPVVYLEPGTLYTVNELYMTSDASSILDVYFGGEMSTRSAIDVSRVREAVRRCDAAFPRGDGRPPGRKLFAGRGGSVRVLQNQDEIEARLVEMGFELVRVDGMSVETQIRLFRQASLVIAPTGAHLTNMVWCAPGTHVIVLTSDHASVQLYLWELLGRVSGVRVSFLKGKRAFRLNGKFAVHDDYFVDSEAVLLAALSETRQR